MPDWCSNLVFPSDDGFSVRVADFHRDITAVMMLIQEFRADSNFFNLIEYRKIYEWASEICRSRFWLVLLLEAPNGSIVGLAISQYIGYDITLKQRILRCSYLYVRRGQRLGLVPLSGLLLSAIFEAAKRSPLVREVFAVTVGARRSLSSSLARQGFSCIGTQHFQSTALVLERSFDDIHEFKGSADFTNPELSLLIEYGRSFYKESARSFLAVTEDVVDQRIKFELDVDHSKSTKIVARQDGQIAGIITGYVDEPNLTSYKVLTNSFFYVHPKFRGTSTARQLFGAFSLKAKQLGLDGVRVGTSSMINSTRVGRFLALLGYRHIGEVYSKQVPRPLPR